MATRRVYTVGHSSRTATEFLHILQKYNIQFLADVRRFPGSRRMSYFGKEELESTMSSAGIGYKHFESLGGRRSRNNLINKNTAWEVDAFRGYADYALTDVFQTALRDLQQNISTRLTAIMCAEAVPWRCHRRIIADYLQLIYNEEVFDIISEAKAEPHRLSPAATACGHLVIYPKTGL